MSDPKSQVVTLDVLQAMLAAQAKENREALAFVVQELRKPTEPTEAEKATIAQDIQMRKDRGQTELNRIANKKAEQANCLHMRRDGSSTCVHIFGSNTLNDYMICQQCQGMIHREPAPTGPVAKEFENGHIFNTRLYQEHFLKSPTDF
jgi:hypothetical protein